MPSDVPENNNTPGSEPNIRRRGNVLGFPRRPVASDPAYPAPATDSAPPAASIEELKTSLTEELSALVDQRITELLEQPIWALNLALKNADATAEQLEIAEARASTRELALTDALLRVESLEQTAADARARAVAAEQRRDTFEHVWDTAPLRVHLNFVHDLLDGEHPLRAVIDEAIRLEGVRQKRVEFEGWIESYPLLFVESAARLLFDPAVQSLETPGAPLSPIERLTLAVRARAQRALESTLEESGVRWILPQPGQPVSEDCAVAGEEDAPAGITPGTVARVARPGYFWRGRVQQPALVWRASLSPISLDSPIDSLASAATEEPVEEAPGATLLAAESTGSWPEWLKDLTTRSLGLEDPEAMQEIAALRTLFAHSNEPDVDDSTLTERLRPVLSLLTSRNARRSVSPDWGVATSEQRPALLDWLNATYGITLLQPGEREPFDDNTMVVIGTRRTAFAGDKGRVAKLDTIGLQRAERVLMSARVLCYTIGDES